MCLCLCLPAAMLMLRGLALSCERAHSGGEKGPASEQESLPFFDALLPPQHVSVAGLHLCLYVDPPFRSCSPTGRKGLV